MRKTGNEVRNAKEVIEEWDGRCEVMVAAVSVHYLTIAGIIRHWLSPENGRETSKRRS